MTGIERLTVSMFLGEAELELGELVMANSRIYFKYSSAFLEKGIELSPFKMKLTSEIISAEREPFDGLFGVFNDSLPDGWGRLLLDRSLSAKGININRITPMDRLAYVGSSGMGALRYRPVISSSFDSDKKIELDEIANKMKTILEGESSEVLDELFHLGGSSGGARPKINIGFNASRNHIIHGTEDLAEGYEHWIIKFPSSQDNPDIANIEYAYHKMALEAGINMSECRLFTGNSGEVYFGTKRFDRVDGKRVHMHSASGLLHDDFKMSTMDYGHLMDCASRLENSVLANSKVLRLAAFNIYAHNRDDHSKNFAFLMDEAGTWEMAPAYDLTFSYSGHGHHSTMIAGESKNPGQKQLMELANAFGVKEAKSIIDEVRNAIANWDSIAKECGVRKESSRRISKVIN